MDKLDEKIEETSGAEEKISVTGNSDEPEEFEET